MKCEIERMEIIYTFYLKFFILVSLSHQFVLCTVSNPFS